jgi:hypothetical protein
MRALVARWTDAEVLLRVALAAEVLGPAAFFRQVPPEGSLV